MMICSVSAREIGTRNFPANLDFLNFPFPGKFMFSKDFCTLARISVVLMFIIPT